MYWTPEREHKLKELWKKGHTASQIAGLLGDTTRNAVIGKAHRLNLQARAASRKSTHKVNTENNNPPTKAQKLGKKARFKALLLDKNFEPENPKKLEELTDKTCRYPNNHPGDENFYFCGRKPFEKEVYCRLHLMLCFQPKNVKEEDIVSQDDLPVYEESWMVSI